MKLYFPREHPQHTSTQWGRESRTKNCRADLYTVQRSYTHRTVYEQSSSILNYRRLRSLPVFCIVAPFVWIRRRPLTLGGQDVNYVWELRRRPPRVMTCQQQCHPRAVYYLYPRQTWAGGQWEVLWALQRPALRFVECASCILVIGVEDRLGDDMVKCESGVLMMAVSSIWGLAAGMGVEGVNKKIDSWAVTWLVCS